MSTLTVRLPNHTSDRLKSYARSRGQSVNKVIEEMSVQALAVWDTETRFHAMSKQGHITQALVILDRLDTEDKN